MMKGREHAVFDAGGITQFLKPILEFRLVKFQRLANQDKCALLTTRSPGIRNTSLECRVAKVVR